jgi:uncharacterized protein (DUF302 family)
MGDSAGRVLGGLAIATTLLGPLLAHAQPAVERTPYLLMVRVKAPFDDVMTTLQEAIKRRNYVITGINNMDDILARRSADIGGPALEYERYRIVGFCNLTFADEGVRRNPNVGVFLPCRALVYRARGATETTVVAVRPTFLIPALGGAGMKELMERAEADILAILEEVVAD